MGAEHLLLALLSVQTSVAAKVLDNDLQIIGDSPHGEDLLTKVETWLPDVVVMDLLLAGGIDGIEATSQVRLRSPQTQGVVLTASTGEARLVGALREGAIGYVHKDAEKLKNYPPKLGIFTALFLRSAMLISMTLG